VSYAAQVPDPGGNHRPAPSSPLVVTQDQLSLYQELCEVAREKELLRRRIMDLLDQGAAVEPGNLSVEIKPQEARLLTAEKLRAVLGPERVEVLRAQVEPTVRRQLIVRPVASWPGNAGQVHEQSRPFSMEDYV